MTKINVLDKGYVKLLNISGPVRRMDENYDADDIDPALTARISFNNFLDKERTREQELKLVEYLIKNKHNTPVEMIEVWLEMKLPIFIARQFVRHRTACINEISGRYATLPEDWYIPEVVGGKAVNNKQGQEDNLDKITQDWFKDQLHWSCYDDYINYLEALAKGIAPEHARLLLHVNHYTNWVWKQDLHNLLHFLAVRMDNHAQVEARKYANAIYGLLKEQLPDFMEIALKYRLN
jgi:thymidylate synthase (FAD)